MSRDTDEVRRAERVQFDKVSATYDRVRPTYPPALFDEVFARASPGQRVLEIGPGTGQATAALLAHGSRVTAVEPGVNLAAMLRRKFEGEERLEVVGATFEEAALGADYDLVFAATSFHWIDPDVKFVKAHAVLRPDGWLGIVSTVQVSSPVDGGYFARSQAVYRRFFGENDDPHEHNEDVVPEEVEEVAASGLFRPAELFRFRWDQTYATVDYADLMRTYSNMQTMEPDAREALIGELSALIDAEFGGRVTRPLVITLTLAQRD